MSFHRSRPREDPAVPTHTLPAGLLSFGLTLLSTATPGIARAAEPAPRTAWVIAARAAAPSTLTAADAASVSSVSTLANGGGAAATPCAPGVPAATATPAARSARAPLPASPPYEASGSASVPDAARGRGRGAAGPGGQ